MWPTKLQRAGKQTLGHVTFATFIDDKPQAVVAALPPEAYDRAVEAHKKRQAVIVVGDLMREGQRWHLRNARDLSVVTPNET